MLPPPSITTEEKYPMTDDPTSEQSGPFGSFEGRPVLSAAIELPSLAGGLREAAEVSGGRAIHFEEEGYLLIKFKGNKTRFDPVKNTGGVQRVDIPLVEGLAFVEGKTYEAAIERQSKALEKHRLREQKEAEAAAGTQRVPGTEPWGDEEDGLPPAPGEGLSAVPDEGEADA